MTTAASSVPPASVAEVSRTRRAMMLVEACAAGAHAHQILLRRRLGAEDAGAFEAGDWDDGRLAGLVRTHESLLACGPEDVSAWLLGGCSGSAADVAIAALGAGPRPLLGSLPYRVAEEFFTARAADEGMRLRALGLAHLLQVNLEGDRDGGLLQDTFRFLRHQGLLGAPADFGIPDDDGEMLKPAGELAARCAAAPFKTDAAAWQLSLRRVQNWAARHRGERGAGACAVGLLETPDIQALLPALRAIPAQRILVVGFSYTMDLHWSTDAPMNSIAGAVMARVNPGVTFAHLGHGGMTMRQARDKFLAAALEAGAQRVFLVAALPTDADYAAAAGMADALRSGGARSVCIFDRLHPDPGWWANPHPDKLRDMAAGAGIEVIKVADAMRAHPRRDEFVSLDGEHMRTPYHLWMAGEWLAWLALR